MHLVINHSIQCVNGSYYLILNLDPSLYEFANEFRNIDKAPETLFVFIEKLKKKYPTLKITAVKIMIGSLLLSTIPIYAQNATSSPEQVIEVSQKIEHPSRFNMSYLYFGTLSNHYQYMDYAGHALNVISPSYFDIDTTGQLTLNTRLLNTTFIKDMQNRGIKVVPFLSNHFHRQGGQIALNQYRTLAEELAYYIELYNLDGINVDIENVTHTEKELYTAFVKYLRELLPAHKEVSVAVAANPKGWSLGWHGSYDYAALAQHSDYLMIMAYDEHYYGSTPGPIASSSFVEASIHYALKHVSPDKIVLGLPFFGRFWKEGDAVGGHGIHLTQVERLKELYEHKMIYDTITKSPKLEVTIKANDPPFNIFGRPLTPGKYTIWYENADSLKHKLTLVQKYNLKGTGSWSLGQEPSDVWNYYNLWLNGQYFEDIETSWARDAIIEIVNKNWMVGVGNNRFNPKADLTRAEAATLLTRALNLPPVQSSPITYKDITGHWAEPYIKTIASHGIMIGFEDQFFPNRPLTREEMAMLLYRIIDLPNMVDGHTLTFEDVTLDRWSYEPIQQMANKGILKGYENKTFRPAHSITREEVASLLLRIADEIETFEAR